MKFNRSTSLSERDFFTLVDLPFPKYVIALSICLRIKRNIISICWFHFPSSILRTKSMVISPFKRDNYPLVETIYTLSSYMKILLNQERNAFHGCSVHFLKCRTVMLQHHSLSLVHNTLKPTHVKRLLEQS